MTDEERREAWQSLPESFRRNIRMRRRFYEAMIRRFPDTATATSSLTPYQLVKAEIESIFGLDNIKNP